MTTNTPVDTGLPYETPSTTTEVAANRRAYLATNPTLERSLTWVIVGIVALVAIAGAAGSIYNLMDAADATGRASASGIAVWAGAEGVLLAMAAVSVAAAWRGQRTPAWSRWVMWAAAAFAVALNLTASHDQPGIREILLLVAAPIGTAGGVEVLAWNARSALDVRTGADQHAAIVAKRRQEIRAARWATRAAAWKTTAGLGGYARSRARVHIDGLAVDDQQLTDTLKKQLIGFIDADASFAPVVPAIEAAPVARHDEGELEPSNGPEKAELERITDDVEQAATTALEQQPERPALPVAESVVQHEQADDTAEFAAQPHDPTGPDAAGPYGPAPRPVLPWFDMVQTGPAPARPAVSADTTGLRQRREMVAVRADEAEPHGPDNTEADQSTKPQVSIERAESPAPAQTTGPDDPATHLAEANKKRQEKARAERRTLALAWLEAVRTDPALTKESFAADRRTTASRVRRALDEYEAERRKDEVDAAAEDDDGSDDDGDTAAQHND
ncbi:DUF2637 domain-containing protein [Streptomyces hydrogenans]|uniref:DUF2637 domain-containing protein n=1 Tax=Streptomyces hydrogenans TaxID=1873719 RepID=UPI0037FC2454